MAAAPARLAAFAILLDVERRAAFVDELLHSARLDALARRDRALVTEIVLGVLRRRGELDWMIERTARRRVAKLDPEIRAALRIGAYQLRRLERIPAHAAVSDSVELVKSAGKPRAAGLVNAVLRRLPDSLEDSRAAGLDYPGWMVERWRKNLGKETTRGVLAAGLSKPPAYIRLSRRFPAAETLERLQAQGVETAASDDVPGAYRVVTGRVAGTPCEREGRLRIQNISSQATVPLLRLQPGHTFLDLCAAPGGKTAQAIDALGGPAGVVACDLRPGRLRLLRRLGAEQAALVASDATRSPFTRKFDRVLLDAPCSGTGTLAANPDIKWRLELSDLANLQDRQIALLRAALDVAAPGGAVVYSTCSLEPEENQQVVEAVLADRPEVTITERMQRIPGRDEGDGFFAVRLERRQV